MGFKAIFLLDESNITIVCSSVVKIIILSLSIIVYVQLTLTNHKMSLFTASDLRICTHQTIKKWFFLRFSWRLLLLRDDLDWLFYRLWRRWRIVIKWLIGRNIEIGWIMSWLLSTVLMLHGILVGVILAILIQSIWIIILRIMRRLMNILVKIGILIEIRSILIVIRRSSVEIAGCTLIEFRVLIKRIAAILIEITLIVVVIRITVIEVIWILIKIIEIIGVLIEIWALLIEFRVLTKFTISGKWIIVSRVVIASKVVVRRLWRKVIWRNIHSTVHIWIKRRHKRLLRREEIRTWRHKEVILRKKSCIRDKWNHRLRWNKVSLENIDSLCWSENWVDYWWNNRIWNFIYVITWRNIRYILG